jgi:1,4-alpha-glucan branching enzyme
VTHLAEYLGFHATHQVCRPAPSSWGSQGFNAFWLNDTNEWIYPHLHEATERMIRLATGHPQARGLQKRALNQAARELLLSQASDWAFIMSTGTMVDYATRRTTIHLRRFSRLYEDILSGKLDHDWLIRLEYLDNIFPDLDYRVYRPRD